MSTTETNLTNKLRLLVSKLGGRLWRANAGKFWGGKRITLPPLISAKLGSRAAIVNPSPIQGLPKGFSDTFGFVPVEITPEMVGKTLAVFVALEVKAEDGKLRKEQISFIKTIHLNNGIAAFVRSRSRCARRHCVAYFHHEKFTIIFEIPGGKRPHAFHLLWGPTVAHPPGSNIGGPYQTRLPRT